MKSEVQEVLNQERNVLLNEAESLAHMGSWKWTEHDNKLDWSQGLYHIFGKKKDDLITWDTFLDCVVPEDFALMDKFLRNVKENKQGASISYRIIRDGEVRYVYFSVKPHVGLNIDVLGAVVDVTEHRAYEVRLQQNNLFQSMIIQELDEKEKKYRTLFERSIDPIFLATDKLELTDANDSFLQFFGYVSKNDLAITIESLFTDSKDYLYFRNVLSEVGFIREFEVSLTTSTGDKKLCLLNCVFIPDQGPGFSCYQGIIHDLTLRKKAESEILIAERFALTGRIARTLAHEVRNPLTNLNLALDQLRDEMPSGNNTAIIYADIIERNANRIEKLISEMLTSSKPNQLRLELTNIDTLIADTISLAQDRLQLNHIQLNVTCQASLPRILIDKEKMQTALLNIIINAIEAMIPGEGVLTIAAEIEKGVLTITISDTGKGIPAKDLDKLFDPFFTSKQMGMGLGLTSTKNILTGHNVQIDVQSVEGVGTSFYLRFILAE